MSTSQEEIVKTFWKAFERFKGKLDLSLYRDYGLALFFLKWLSDNYEEQRAFYTEKYKGKQTLIRKMLDREPFVLDETCTFDVVHASRAKASVGERINNVLGLIEAKNPKKLNGFFGHLDFNSSALFGEGQRNWQYVIEALNSLKLNPSALADKTTIGNAYENIIKTFAEKTGKKGGDFFTPEDVSDLIAKLLKVQENITICDPVCGTASLLLRTVRGKPDNKVVFYAQEKNRQNYILAQMNLFFHKITNVTVAWGDTLTHPRFVDNKSLLQFDVEVADLPFSEKGWAEAFTGSQTAKMRNALDPYDRFAYGVPPNSRADYAFIQHMLKSLKPDGIMATIAAPGVLYRGGAEQGIRTRLIQENLLDCVIQLPKRIFYGSDIAGVVLIFKKNRQRNDLLIIDADRDRLYDTKQGKSRLKTETIDRIFELYHHYNDDEPYAERVTQDEIAENDYNLNISRYVDIFEKRQSYDLKEMQEQVNKLETERVQLNEKYNESLKELMQLLSEEGNQSDN